MLSKRDVSAYVEHMQEQAEKKVKEEYDAVRSVIENRILDESGIRDPIKKMQRLVNQLVKENRELNAVLKNASGLIYQTLGYDGMTRKLSDIECVEKVIKKYLEYDSSDLVRMKKKFEETLRNVRANYATVAAEVKNKTSAKRAVEYLKELGFDVTRLEQMQNTEIMVQLDKRYLFVGGGLKNADDKPKNYGAISPDDVDL